MTLHLPTVHPAHPPPSRQPGGALTRRLSELAVLGAARPRALGPGLVATLVAVFLRQPSLGVDTLDQAPLDATTAGG